MWKEKAVVANFLNFHFWVKFFFFVIFFLLGLKASRKSDIFRSYKKTVLWQLFVFYLLKFFRNARSFAWKL